MRTPTLAAAVVLAACGSPVASLDGKVVCWGLGRSGQIGDGQARDDNPPTAITAGTADLRALFAGSSATCGLRAGGGLACWGELRGGHASRAPVPFALVPDASEIVFGDGHACARAGGRVLCWGRNLIGQLGDGSGPDPDARIAVHLGSDGSVTPVGSAREIVADVATPVAVRGLTDATQLAAGSSHTCALRADGTVVCWGDDGYGQLGDGRHGYAVWSDHPVAVAGLTGAVAIAAGGRYSCARLAAGGVSCWGANASAYPEDGSKPVAQPTATPIAGLAHVQGVAIQGEGGACALVDGGDVRCWRAAGVVQPADVHGAAQLAAGMEHTCARLAADGGVVCWGADANGELGVSSDNPRLTPVRRLDHVTSIAAGARHVCALR